MDGFPEIKQRIKALEAELSMYPSARLMAVIKTRTCEEIEYAVKSCGITLVGENRSSELLLHEPALSGAETHFIGTLQKNKVKYLIGRVSMIESVDSPALAREINRVSALRGEVTDVLVEVNTGREPQKGGIFPEVLPELLSDISALLNIRLRGLMTVAPVCESSAEKSMYFKMLRELRDENKRYFHSPLLSMGMSGSYREALSEGADIIRIGTGIFGERK